MSARRPIFNHLVAPAAGGPISPEAAKSMLNAYRAEVLAEAADEVGARCEEHGVFGVDDLLRRMAKDRALVEKDTLTGTTSTPQPTTIENYPGELAMLRGLLGVIRVVAEHGDMDEVRRLLAEHASDEQAAYAEGAA